MGFEEIRDIEDAEIVYEEPKDVNEKELMNSFKNDGELDFDKMMNSFEKRNYTKAKVTKKQKKARAKMVKASRKKNRK